MKGVSGVIIVILLVLISISLVGSLYIWATNTTFDIYPEEDIEQKYQRSRACLSIDDIDGASGTAIIRNCGLVPLSDVELYLDNSRLDFAYPDVFDPNDELIVTFTSPVSGEHTYYAIANLAETPLITSSN